MLVNKLQKHFFTTIHILKFAAQQVNIYFGLFISITDELGGLLNIIVFSALKTFRYTTCGTYLIAALAVNFGQSLVVLMRVFTSILTNGLINSLQFLTLLTIICLVTIDDFLSVTRYRNINNIQFAYIVILLLLVFYD